MNYVIFKMAGPSVLFVVALELHALPPVLAFEDHISLAAHCWCLEGLCARVFVVNGLVVDGQRS